MASGKIKLARCFARVHAGVLRPLIVMSCLANNVMRLARTFVKVSHERVQKGPVNEASG